MDIFDGSDGWARELNSNGFRLTDADRYFFNDHKPKTVFKEFDNSVDGLVTAENRYTIDDEYCDRLVFDIKDNDIVRITFTTNNPDIYGEFRSKRMLSGVCSNRVRLDDGAVMVDVNVEKTSEFVSAYTKAMRPRLDESLLLRELEKQISESQPKMR